MSAVPLGWPTATVRPLAFAHRVRSRVARRRAGTRAIGGSRSAFYDRAWRDAAAELGFDVRGLGGDLLEILGDAGRWRVCRNYTPLDDSVTLMVAGDKPLVLTLLGEAGVPTPRHREFRSDSLGAARQLLAEVGGPCVVKPARNTSAGAGVSTQVTDRTLVAAAAAAATGSRDLLIEEQIAGANLRLLYIDGELADAVERRPPSVLGDGTRTVRALIDAENADRLASGWELSQVLLTRDQDMRRTLASQELSYGSVPAAGRRVVLKTVVNQNDAKHTHNVTEGLSPELVRDGARAAAAVGSRLAGVDVITTDFTRPLSEAGGVVLEVNTTPGFYHHYHQQGGFCAVALHVLEVLAREPARSLAPAAGDAP